MTDLGIRCEEHVGEVFPPRCSACERLQEFAREQYLEDPQWAEIPPPEPDGWGPA